MASIKNLKKGILYTYGALLDQCYLIQMVFPKVDPEAAQALCQEIENAYSASLDKLSRQQEKNSAARAKAARKEFDATVEALSAKLEKLVGEKA